MKIPYLYVLAALLSATVFHGSANADDVVVKYEDLAITESELDYIFRKAPDTVQRQVEAEADARLELFATTLASKRVLANVQAMTPETDGDLYYKLQFALIAAAREFDQERFQKQLDIPDLEPLAEERYRVSMRDIALVPESRLASHILLMCRDECDREAVKENLAAIRQRVLEGEDFSALAEELSEDPLSAENGGTLKTEIQRDNARIDETFREAVFTLSKVDDVSDIVETQFGFHLIRLDGITPEYIRPFSEVEVALKAEIERRYRADAYKNYLLSLGPQSQLEIDYDAVDAILGPLPAGSPDVAPEAPVETSAGVPTPN